MDRQIESVHSMSNKEEIKINETSSQPGKRRRGLQRGFARVGAALRKVNLPRLIDEMERDQELADKLEIVNKDLKDEADRKEIVRESLAACHAEMKEHLDEFLHRRPTATYEEWIKELHPENVSPGRLLEDFDEVDIRFYVPDSDHRLLWNSSVGLERRVQSRSVMYDEAFGLVTVDLLE